MSLTAQELSQLESLVAKAKAGAEVREPKVRPRGMSEAEHAEHVAASEAEHARNEAYNADPRAAHFALEARVAQLEGKAAPAKKAKS